jgi:hypothetical protein
MYNFLDVSKSYCNSAVHESNKTNLISKKDKCNIIHMRIAVETFFFMREVRYGQQIMSIVQKNL